MKNTNIFLLCLYVSALINQAITPQIPLIASTLSSASKRSYHRLRRISRMYRGRDAASGEEDEGGVPVGEGIMLPVVR